MRIKSFIFWLVFCSAAIYVLNRSFGTTPALGYLLSPSHGFWQQLEGSEPEIPQEVLTDYVNNPVEVIWDSTLVPHVYAETDNDLYFVQGYITASMRLWQMDFQTRVAAGRISEVVGEQAIEFDKSMRRKGMLIGAQKSANASFMDQKVRVAYEQYAAGVNAYIETLDSRTLPLEYKLLDMQPEAWSPLKSMLLLEYMANMLNTHNNDIEYTRFLEAYGFNEWQLLFGGKDDASEPIVDSPGKWKFDPITKSPIPSDIPQPPKDLADRHKPDPDNGSNNWAVAPKKSANGFAMLANDPHLSLNLPSLWFLVHLKSGEQNVMGASLPGTAGIVIGFNEKISWGFTNAQRDLVDWYKIQFADASRSSIIVDDTSVVEINKIVEQINVKGGKTVYDTMYTSPYGIIADYAEPVIEEPNAAWAYKWIGQEKSEVGLALYLLNHGSSMADYMAATNHFHSPAQNIVFADVEGNIGIRVQGRYLVRAENEGLFLRDGTRSENQWTQYIPANQNISQFNPERGFVSSANQYPVDNTYPYFIAASKYENYRNRRINTVLGNDTAVSVADMKALHSDNFNIEAEENLRYWLAALDYGSLNEKEQKVFKLLMNWNYFSHPEMQEPAYYDAWRNAILQNAWDEINTSDMPQPSAFRTFKLLQDQPQLAWWDISLTDENENAKALIQYAFSQAISELEMWMNEQGDTKLAFNWANFKNTSITHLSQQEALSKTGVFIGGNRGIVNATSKRNGPSWRQIIVMNPNGIEAYGIYPGGQSGNPGSAFYTNWVEPWAAGDYLTMNINSPQASLSDETPIQITHFKPKN